MNIRYIIICIAVVAFIASGFYLYIWMNTPKIDLSGTAKNNEKPAATATPTPIPSSSPVPAKAWDIFQEFLAGMQAHDLSRINKVAYEQIDPNVYCEDLGLGLDGNACLDMIWSMADVLGEEAGKQKETDFVNVSEDKNQTIMATNVSLDSDGGNTRRYVYFVKNPEGNTLVLTSGSIGWHYTGDALTNAIKDSDGDNLPDEDENCEGARKADKSCVKTNPNLKDTDGDGWWDSIEDAAKTDPNNSADYPF